MSRFTVLLVCLGTTVFPSFAEQDVFGIEMLKPSRTPGLEWNSLHWASGAPRTISGWDVGDPSGWSRQRGITSSMEVDGNGVMTMGGEQPRLYIMPASAGKLPFFRDIEFTGYYRRSGTDGAPYAGFVVGVRSGAEGHTETGHCLANTYYLAFRHSGTWVFDKELDHPNDASWESGDLFQGGLPSDRWIGMKFLVYNLSGDKAVKLEAYIDSVSGGDVSRARWEMVGEVVDDGNWAAPPGDCGYPANTVITEGGGVVFIRDTQVERVQYKMVSWREIDPDRVATLRRTDGGSSRDERAGSFTIAYTKRGIAVCQYAGQGVAHVNFAVYDMNGHRISGLRPSGQGGRAFWDGTDVDGHRVGPGVYIITARIDDRCLSRSVVQLP
jgi:hypothetical protein